MTPSPPNTPAVPPGDPRPVILFDGVCNLCNATVQWVIQRDRGGAFAMASLQSRAARDLLRAAGVAAPESLPDSIALIDANGVHLRSDAAMGIGRRLGFPYSLIGLARPLPRRVRDGVYDWVARNRYRWFGRRDTCMIPTADVAHRFLDDGELERGGDEARGEGPATQAVREPAEGTALDSPAHEHAGAAAPDSPSSTGPARADLDPEAPASWLSAWGSRFAITYVLVYMAPFPLTLLGYLGQIPGVERIPGLTSAVGWVISLHGRIMAPLVAWFGESAFGVEATFAFTGSGDQTFNYVDLVVDLLLALLISIVWATVAKKRRVGPRIFDGSWSLARFYLGTTMLTYGWIKLFPLQFTLPGPDRLLQPYGDSSPMGLAWTFLGASVGYQMFAGLSELIGGYLLFWRRTALLGSLVSAAVLLNVLAINVFFDIPVKLFSAHLLLMAVFIMAPDLPRLTGLFGFGLPTVPERRRPFWAGWASVGSFRLGWVHLLFVVALSAIHVSNNLATSRSRGVLADPHPLAGVYRVDSFELEGRTELDDGERWVRVGLNPRQGVATVQWASGLAVRMRLAVDEEGRTLSFYDRGGSAPETPDMSYRLEDGGGLRLEGRFQGDSIRAVALPAGTGALLTRRGFRWINEYPFNR